MFNHPKVMFAPVGSFLRPVPFTPNGAPEYLHDYYPDTPIIVAHLNCRTLLAPIFVDAEEAQDIILKYPRTVTVHLPFQEDDDPHEWYLYGGITAEGIQVFIREVVTDFKSSNLADQ